MDSIISTICYIACGFVAAWLIFADKFQTRYGIVEIFYKVNGRNELDWDYRFNIAHDKESRDAKLDEIFSDESEEANSKIVLQFNSADDKSLINVNKNFFNLSKKEGLKF